MAYSMNEIAVQNSMMESAVQIVLFVFAFGLLVGGIILAFKGREQISIAPLSIATVLIIIGAVGPYTLKDISLKWGKGGGELNITRRNASEEEIQILAQAGQKDISPEIKQTLDQIAEDAKRRKDEERAPEDYVVLADKAWREKRYEDGLRLAYAGLNLEPKDPRTRAAIYNLLGLIYDGLEPYSLAEKNYQKAIEIDDTFPLPHNNLGVLYTDQKKYDLAEEAYKKALKLNPKYVGAYNNLGVIYQKQEKYKEAEEAYKKALELNPKLAHAHNNLGNVYKDQQKYDLAEAAYQNALKLYPNNMVIYNNLGNLYTKLNRFSEAEDYIKKAVALDSTVPVFHDSLGELYMEQGKLDEAEAAFNKALELDPELEEARENLEKLRKMRGGDEDSPKNPTIDKGQAKSKKFP